MYIILDYLLFITIYFDSNLQVILQIDHYARFDMNSNMLLLNSKQKLYIPNLSHIRERVIEQFVINII
jgi:hypothetical protein